MTSQISPLFATSDGKILDEDDVVRTHLEQINAVLKNAPDISSYVDTLRAKNDIWYETAFFFDNYKQLAAHLQKEIAVMAHLQGRKLACEAKLKLQLKSRDHITHLKMKRCAEQANLRILSRTSTKPFPLSDTGFYIKTKDGQVHHTKTGTLYIGTHYCLQGNRETYFQVKPAKYRLPLWINIPKAVHLFRQFTSNLDKPVLERVAKTYEDNNGLQKKTVYWGIFGGPDHYVRHLTKCATDEKGELIPFGHFCDRWVELEKGGEKREDYIIRPPCFQTNQGSGCLNDPYLSDWDSICTEQNQFMQDTPREQAVDELKALGVWPDLTFSETFHSDAEEALMAALELPDSDVPEPIGIYP